MAGRKANKTAGGKQNAKKTQEETPSPCLICTSDVTQEGGGLQCESCLLWIHIPCSQIATSVYSSLSQIKNLVYLCNHCLISKGKESSLSKIDGRINKIVKQQEQNTIAIRDLLSAVTSYTTDVLNLKKELADIRNEIVLLKSTPIPQTSNLSDNRRAKPLNLNPSSRDQNVIVYNIPENDDLDIDKINSLLDFMEIPKHLVVDLVRLGKSNDGKWPRPLKMTTLGSTAAQSILKKAYKLAKFNAYELKIYLKPDYTLEQRDMERKLIAKRRKLIDNGIQCKLRGLNLVYDKAEAGKLDKSILTSEDEETEDDESSETD